MKTQKKLTWAFALIGGLYAFIPFIGFIYWWMFSTTGEPGPAFLLILPPFWPALLTFSIVGFPLALINNLFPSLSNGVIEAFTNLLNIFLWSIIGFFVGKIIVKMRAPISVP
ncbi:MAG: hypothetical protein AABX12_00670 [Nanoarchaeota archaeon]